MTDQQDSHAQAEAARDQLLREMRRIRETAQLSFGRLAHRTHYSRSSWERFLNGKQLPTRVAVEQLAAVTGDDPEPLLALLKRATDAPAGDAPADGTPVDARSPGATAAPGSDPAPSGGAAAGEPTEAEPGRAGRARFPAIPPMWRRRLTAVGYVALGTILGSVATALLVSNSMNGNTLSDTPGGRDSAASGSPRMELKEKVIRIGCRSDTCLRHDPQAKDCQWDATTTQATWLRGMHIQLRYSAACQSVWGRIEGGTVGDRVIIKDARGEELDATIRFENDTYTRMLAVSPEAPLATMTVCGAIPRQREMACAETKTVKATGAESTGAKPRGGPGAGTAPATGSSGAGNKGAESTRGPDRAAPVLP
ncbi:DUF2690 domain-containing protein [Streptomyces sp. NPDC006798]|uniref:helix-turn-helix domain-containing protein n=1 Tax=Streptomyces sp. NPDC006798 TaxID=3155462 RepID=UPI0033D10D32